MHGNKMVWEKKKKNIMTDFQQNLARLMGLIISSCEKSTFLISKREHEKLSNRELMSLKIHLLTCRACRSFRKQLRYLSNGLQNLKNENVVGQLSEEDKSIIQKKLMDELKR
jgi:hypothetical protein